MKLKKTIVLIFSFSFLFFSLSCKMADINKSASYLKNSGLSNVARVSGDGKTPGTAIVLKPETNFKTTQNVAVTVNDNIRWFYINTIPGSSYHLETVGKGDPLMRIYKESQVKINGDYSGDPEVYQNDGAPDGNNVQLVIPGSGGKYLMVMLYAGSKWSGVIKYKKK